MPVGLGTRNTESNKCSNEFRRLKQSNVIVVPSSSCATLTQLQKCFRDSVFACFRSSTKVVPVGRHTTSTESDKCSTEFRHLIPSNVIVVRSPSGTTLAQKQKRFCNSRLACFLSSTNVVPVGLGTTNTESIFTQSVFRQWVCSNKYYTELPKCYHNCWKQWRYFSNDTKQVDACIGINRKGPKTISSVQCYYGYVFISLLEEKFIYSKM